MKKNARLLSFVLCLLLFGTCLFPSLSVSAASEGDSLSAAIAAVYAVDTETLSDAQYATKIFDILSHRISEHYNKKDAPDSVKNEVAEAITQYNVGKIYPVITNPNSTQRNPDVQKNVRDWALKGLYSGTVAWIYHANTDTALDAVRLTVTVEYPSGDQYKTTTDEMSVKEYYEYLIGEAIAHKPDGYFEGRNEQAAEPYFTWLFRAVYEAKLILEAPDDTLPEAQKANAQTALDQAIKDVRTCEYVAGISVDTAEGTTLTDGEDGYNFSQIYAKAESALRIAEALELLYPSKNFAELDATKDFLTELSAKNTNTEINALLHDTVDGLLQGLQGENVTGNAYTYGYIDSIRTALTDTTNAADTEKERIDGDALMALFEGYPLKREQATAKDGLAAYEAELLINADRYAEESAEKTALGDLIAEAMTAIDSAADSETIQTEAKRGHSQAELYDLYRSAAERIEDYVDDAAALLAEAQQEYAAMKENLADAASDTAMDTVLEDAKELMADTVAEAEAEAYLVKHADILSKTTDTLTTADRAALEAAIDDTAPEHMSELALNKLTDQLTELGRAYRYVMGEVVREALENDALTDENDPLKQLNNRVLHTLIDAVDGERVDPTQLSDLKNALNEYLSEAEAIRDVIAHVTDVIRTEPEYPSYASSFTDQIHTLCEQAADYILADDRTQTAEALRDAAILDTDCQEALAKIDLKAKDHKNLNEVTTLLDEVTAAVLNQPQSAEGLDALVAATSFRIDQIVAADEIRSAVEDAKKELNKLSFLNDDEIAARKDALDAMEEANKPLLDSTADLDALNAQKQLFYESLNQKMAEIAAEDAKKEADLKAEEAAKINQHFSNLKETVEQMLYLSDAEKSSFVEKAETIRKEALSKTEFATDLENLCETVRQEYQSAFKAMTEKAKTAEEAARCLFEIRVELEEIKQTKQDYSDENYQKIESILQETEGKLNAAETKEEYLAIQAETKEKVDSVPNRLEDAQNNAAKDLLAVYEELMANRVAYSDQGAAQIDSLYNQTLSTVNGYTDMEKIPEILQLTLDQIAALRAVPVKTVFTEDRTLTEVNPAPKPYDPWGKGYYGSVTVTTGIIPTSKLFIYDAMIDGVAERIMLAAKERRIVDGSGVLLAKDVNRLLKKCSVVKGLDIVLTPVSGQANTYLVSVLLPEGTSMDRVFGAVFLREDGSAEYYEITAEGTLITFTTDHFSEYYVVRSETVNLVPLIVLLSLILAAEIAVLALLYLRKNRRDHGKTVLPAAALLNPYHPDGAWLAITLLSIAILVLAGWIIALLIAEWRAKRKSEKPEEEEEAPDALPAPDPIPALPHRGSTPVLPTRGPIYSLPEPIEVLPEVTVEEAEELMTDETAELLQYTEYEDPEIYTGFRKGEINIDTISDHFEAGDTVTLNALKERNLIAQNVGYIKVLGRGIIDKPLIIVAHRFSTTALKMILLTGGTPVVTKVTPRRKRK